MKYTAEDARRIGDQLNVDWKIVDIEQLRQGLEVETEHTDDPRYRVLAPDDHIGIAKIALRHLDELPDYYTRLRAMERKVKPVDTCPFNTKIIAPGKTYRMRITGVRPPQLDK
ncbi:MAG: DUF5661 family protein [Dehalococcoidia bacterium]|jgi:hypothetical protein